jgi:flagellar biosynthesis GTPase FlhF
MELKFPKTIKAAQAAEQSQWAIGDALLKEAEDRQTGERGLNAVSRELEANGIEFSMPYLRNLRDTAKAFPADRRHNLPWAVHQDAGNPDVLDTIVRGAKKDIDSKTGKSAKVTKWYVRDVLQRQYQEEREERRKAAEVAQHELEKAKTQETEARERERKAKNADERKLAERDRQDATKRKHAAIDSAKTTRTAPRKQNRPAPAEESVPFLVARARFMSGLTEIKGNLKKLGKEIEPYMDEFTPAFINASVEDLLDIANQARALSDVLRKHSSNKRGHLAVVGE